MIKGLKHFFLSLTSLVRLSISCYRGGKKHVLNKI